MRIDSARRRVLRTPVDPARPRPRWRRAFLLGFVLGAALIVPGVFVALLVPAAERLWPFLTPGAALLRPLADVMATWPGAVSMLLLTAVNGLVVGAAAVLTALLLNRKR